MVYVVYIVYVYIECVFCSPPVGCQVHIKYIGMLAETRLDFDFFLKKLGSGM